MRLEYFGDSYDIVKRALLQWLRPLGEWYVQPLFTDEVSAEQANAFSSFLGGGLIRPFQARTRKEYEAALEACKGAGNVFLDPDTGVALPRPLKRVGRTHLSVSAFQALCSSNPSKVIASFDQALLRGAAEKSLRRKIDWLSERQISAVAFRSHASFLFCSNSAARVGDVIRLLLEAGLPERRLVKPKQIYGERGNLLP